MPLNPTIVELVVAGLMEGLDTRVGDKVVHFASNPKTWYGRAYRPESVDGTGSPDSTRRPNEHGSRRDSVESSEKGSSNGRSRSQKQHHTSESHKDKLQLDWEPHWQSNIHQGQRNSEPRALSNQASSDECSRKSCRRTRRYQRPSSPVGIVDDEVETPAGREASEDIWKMEQRREQFRHAKNAYRPPMTQTVAQLKWDEARLYDDVARAVHDAMRQSGELDRKRPR